MINPNISRDNYELLSHLQSGSDIGADREGRLYIIDRSSFLSNFIQKIFQDQKRIQQIVRGFIIEKLQEKQFHEIASGRSAYLELLNQFALSQLREEQKTALAFDYYNQRYRDLIESNIESWRAECQVALEMLDDPYIPSSFKESIQPEKFVLGFYLKDRAGKNIAIIDHPSQSLSTAKAIF